MTSWLRSLPLTVGLFFAILSILSVAQFLRVLYFNPDQPLNVLADNADNMPLLVIAVVGALIGFPLSIVEVGKLFRRPA